MSELQIIDHKHLNGFPVLDHGIDLNRDKHCDLDGWFVDRDFHHRPVFHEHVDISTVNRIKDNMTYQNFLDKINYSGKLYGKDLNKFQYYALNTMYDELSSPVINNVLRTKGSLSASQLSYIDTLSNVIDKFTFNEDFTVY